LAVNPASGNAYLSVSRGKGPDAKPALVKVDQKGKLDVLDLKDVKFASIMLPNASQKNRNDAVTGMAYTDGKLIIAGLSNEEFASNLRVVAVPFKEADKGSGVEIYHGAHGKLETASPVRTFALYEIKGEQNVLAAYTCTPLVRFPVSDLKPGTKVKGTTIAELGNGNRPLDIITYEKGGKTYLLITNSVRGVMKVTTEDIDKVEPITKPAKPKTGLSYETIEDLKGIKQLAKLDKMHALVIREGKEGALTLDTIDLP
jgi:hypothetical protein